MLCPLPHCPPPLTLEPVNDQFSGWGRPNRRCIWQFYQSEEDVEPSHLSYSPVEHSPKRRRCDASSADQRLGGDDGKTPSSDDRHLSWDSDYVDLQPSPRLEPTPSHHLPSLSGVRTPLLGDSYMSLQGPNGGLEVECDSLDNQVAMTGSWCDQTATDKIEHPPELMDSPKYFWGNDWRPPTPTEERLPTPDLPPLCTHYEFCTCCRNEKDKINEEDRINEVWYIASRAKMDDQGM
ncbi:hypothetical protein B0T10DRAFT_194325 [Thelonectria olida]|uniref:Uncharacterized protein n=1 Tax=Thelonectria olida TaxID=1576542 RepID=A0A9P9AKH2_9HYPO|nr:hypothetical protein B0T10DRAFT_194325 [Thelonectria olida]